MRDGDPSIRRELAGMEEAVAMAQAAFDDAVNIRANLATMPIDSDDKSTLRPAVALCNIQLGAARAVLTAMRLRLLGRLAAPRLVMQEAKQLRLSRSRTK